MDRSEPDPDNEIAEIFSHFPELNVSQVAKRVGISKNLLFKYVYGIKKPSAERRAALKETLRLLGKELMGGLKFVRKNLAKRILMTIFAEMTG